MADHSAIGKKSRRKGGAFERAIILAFNQWTKGKFEWTKNKRQENQYEGFVRGDIVPKYTDFTQIQAYPCILAIECKKVEGWELSKLISGQCGKVTNFWCQTEEQAKDTDMIPFLIFAKNHHKPLCMFPAWVLDEAKPKQRGIKLTYFIWSEYVIMNLETFLSCISYATTKRIWERRSK